MYDAVMRLNPQPPTAAVGLIEVYYPSTAPCCSLHPLFHRTPQVEQEQQYQDLTTGRSSATAEYQTLDILCM